MKDNIEYKKLQNSLISNTSLKQKIKKYMKNMLPVSMYSFFKDLQTKSDFRHGNKLREGYTALEEKMRSYTQINVAFFVIESSMWKYDELFKLFLNSSLFAPQIVICPYLNYQGSQMQRIMDEAQTFFYNKKYPYIITYNHFLNTFIDIKDVFYPDIIFYCFPYLSATKESLYGIYHFPKSLICYVPYSSMVCNAKIQFDKTVQNFAWAFFVENHLVKKMLEEYSPTKGNNAITTGFPSLDVYRKNDYVPCNVWKHAQMIKIIWAPHYTILDGVVEIAFSTFLQYCDDMVGLARKYSQEIQVAFKPHPFLYPTLCSYWGKEKTDDYYDIWKNMDNTQLVTGDYVDLFKTSSAMIFDSVSFIVEYLYTQKPSLFTYKKGVENQLNEYGIRAFECHEKASSLQEVDVFIRNLISGVSDDFAMRKGVFYQEYLALPNGRTAADNIYDYIIEKLNK